VVEKDPARVTLDIRGVNDDEPARRQAPNDLAMEDRECRPRPSLVGLVAAELRSEGVRRKDLRRVEVTGGERRLAGTGGADEDDERRVGDDDRRQAADPALPTMGGTALADRAASASATRLSSA
jgi:cell division ATPase FtsA